MGSGPDPVPTMPIVTAVEDLGDYRLRVTFSGAVVREVDLHGELWGPMLEPLRDRAVFAQVRGDHELGTVVWPNGGGLAPEFLFGKQELVIEERAPASPR